MNKPVKHETRNLRQAQETNRLAPRSTEMIAGTKDRVAYTRRMIAQSKTLLGKAREALESSKLLREVPRRVPETKS